MSEITTEKPTSPEQAVRKERRHPHPQHQYGGNRDDRDYHYQQQQQRPHYRKQNRPVYVEDLREKLNRIRRDKDGQGTSFSGPPPDPNYNFLRDPARDGESAAAAAAAGAPHEKRQPYNQSRRPNNEQRGRHYPNRPPQKPTTIQPVNIKVELSTSTGQRSCIVDEEHKLPEIKHVPDVHERSRKFHNTRYYSNNANRNAATPQQQQQQRRPPPPWKQNQQNRRGFKGGERRDEKKGGEAPVLNETVENWDAPASSEGEVGGDVGLVTDDVNEERDLNAAVEEPEQELYESGNENVNEEETPGEATAEKKEEVTKNNEEKTEEKQETATKVEEVGTTSKEAEEADLKKTIIIEATKK